MALSNHPELNKPELMSPAGHWPQLRAAIEAGADAVYFGLDHFSARAKVGFSTEELPEVMVALHERGVKGFVTFNTLVFDEELDRAAKTIELIANANADAVIVQDVGMAARIVDIAPHLPIHGSTQMSVTSAQGCELAKSLGCQRVVLARELSLKDIEKIVPHTSVELETFVHGALCVSYSGQCFSSEAWGGRSANRGQCAQACRLSYDLIVDDQRRELGDSRYLLSPGDLFALEQIPDLIRLGIACFKIEGRYKDENYVSLTTRAYREKIDNAWNSVSSQPSISKQDLEQVYSRGLNASFISGINHQEVVSGRAPRHRGLRIGTVVKLESSAVVVRPTPELDDEIAAGDGIVFDGADWKSPDQPEPGGNIFTCHTRSNGDVSLEFLAGSIKLDEIRVGDWVWRTSNPRLGKRLKPMSSPKSILHTKPLVLTVKGTIGERLVVTAKLDCPIERLPEVQVESARELESSRGQGLSREKLETQLGRLGGSPFHLGKLIVADPSSMENGFLPVSELNRIRRELVDALIQDRLRSRSRAESRLSLPAIEISPGSAGQGQSEQRVQLHILVRNSEQLDAAIALQPDTITLDYLELYGLRPAVNKIKDAGITARVASPRILKPAEQKVVRFLVGLDCEILVRSAGLLFDLLKEEPLPKMIGDFSLNVANIETASIFARMGLTRLTPTYDLNANQVSALASSLPPGRLEVMIFSHLPVFHTEHCVFCRFLSSGTDSTNCGHPCEKHRVSLRDSSGRAHPVMADVGCRNTIFGAEAQSGVPFIEQWRKFGIRDFRIELVHESAKETESIVSSFQNFFEGNLSRRQLQEQLPKDTPSGTTVGSYFVPVEDFKLARKKPSHK